MASPYPTKDVANTIYHSAVITTLVVGYAMIGRKLVKLDVGDPARPDLTEGLKTDYCCDTWQLSPRIG
jgi:hypothetical protein